MTAFNPPSIAGRRRANEMTLLLFIATITMLFAAFTSAWLIRRTGTDWRPITLPRTLWLSTGLAILCSIGVEAARRVRGRPWLLATLGLGAAFLGAQVWAWAQMRDAGAFAASSAHGAFFWLLSAVHGVHVLGGLGAVLAVLVTGRGHGLCAGYWHFLTGLWLYLFVILG